MQTFHSYRFKDRMEYLNAHKLPDSGRIHLISLLSLELNTNKEDTAIGDWLILKIIDKKRSAYCHEEPLRRVVAMANLTYVLFPYHHR